VNINGHGLRDHVNLIVPLWVLIAAVWVLRMILEMADAPHGLLRIVSVTGATAFSVLIGVMLMHVRRFGSYANVVIISFLLSAWGQFLICIAIAFTALTGRETIYAQMRFAGHAHTAAQHIAGQLTFGIGSGTIMGTLMGCFFLWMLRRLPADAAPSVKS